MTKRHHTTNYHRCKECGQPLVKERIVCFSCAEHSHKDIPPSDGGNEECHPTAKPEPFRP